MNKRTETLPLLGIFWNSPDFPFPPVFGVQQEKSATGNSQMCPGTNPPLYASKRPFSCLSHCQNTPGKLPPVSPDFPGFPLVSLGFPRISPVFPGFPRIWWQISCPIVGKPKQRPSCQVFFTLFNFRATGPHFSLFSLLFFVKFGFFGSTLAISFPQEICVYEGPCAPEKFLPKGKADNSGGLDGKGSEFQPLASFS